MEELLPLLVAAAVASFVYGAWKVAAALTDKERRKLTERLSTDTRLDPAAASAKAIKIQLDSGSLPAILSRSQFFNELNRRLAQTLPGMSVTKFLSISAALAAFAGLLMLLR